MEECVVRAAQTGRDVRVAGEGLHHRNAGGERLQRGAHAGHHAAIQIADDQAEEIALVDLDDPVAVAAEHRGRARLERGVGERQRHVIAGPASVADAEVERARARDRAFGQGVERAHDDLGAIVIEDDERHAFHRQEAAAHGDVQRAIAKTIRAAHVQLVVPAAGSCAVEFHREIRRDTGEVQIATGERARAGAGRDNAAGGVDDDAHRARAAQNSNRADRDRALRLRTVHNQLAIRDRGGASIGVVAFKGHRAGTALAYATGAADDAAEGRAGIIVAGTNRGGVESDIAAPGQGAERFAYPVHIEKAGGINGDGHRVWELSSNFQADDIGIDATHAIANHEVVDHRTVAQ